MKKTTALALLIIGLLVLNAVAGDFRKANWGMAVEEVKATEEPKIGVEGVLDYLVTLVYEDTVSGLSCKTKYFFINDSSESALVLLRGRYIFTDPVWEDDQFFWNYKAIKDLVTNAYGEPYEDRVGWTPGTATGPAEKSLDISYLAQWQTSSTHVYLVMEGYKDMWGFFLEYYSKELKNLEHEALEKQDSQASETEATEKVVFVGTPRVRIIESGTERKPEHLAENEGMEYQCIITEVDDEYFWTTRENVELVPVISELYITFLATNGSGYVRMVNPEYKDALNSVLGETEQDFDYIEHMLLGLTTYSYYGRSE